MARLCLSNGLRGDLGLQQRERELAQLFPDGLPTLKETEHILISEALRRADGNQGIAAGMLGRTRQALNKRLIRNRQSGVDKGECRRLLAPRAFSAQGAVSPALRPMSPTPKEVVGVVRVSTPTVSAIFQK
ncbi:MAG: helix-turn-helix domain-containing protein [Acidiferrobacterales bacterium]